MTNLSPAASAILRAFDDRHEVLGPFEGNWQEVCLAAAIRAAAEELQHRLFLPGTDLMVVSAKDLFNLANELEGGND
jgi:hypothetical protein